MELTNHDIQLFERCELQIKQGLEKIKEGGIEAGEALRQVQDRKLYRLDYTTFEKYIEEKWGLKKARAYQLINASKIRNNVAAGKKSTIVDFLPANEYQARPLAPLEPELQRQAWDEVVKTHGQSVTGSQVARIAEKYKEDNEALKEIKQQEKPYDVTVFRPNPMSEKEVLQKAKELKEKRKQEFIAKQQERIEKEADKPMSEEEREILNRLNRGETVVINMNKHFSVLKYAQDNGIYVRIDRYSEWGNPFYLPSDGDRDHVCDAYSRYLEDKRSLHGKINDLRGKVLGCHCHPHRCHGDEIIKFLNK